jgi:putative radical SAM enzyme (TIGR03279 family)
MMCGCDAIGSVSASQAGCCGFEPRQPLNLSNYRCPLFNTANSAPLGKEGFLLRAPVVKPKSQMVTIKNIIPDSPANDMGLLPGDRLVTINDHPVSDAIGVRFWSSESELAVIVNRDGQTVTLHCEKDPDENLGVVLHPIRIKRCLNRCVFCYVDQLPGGLRAPLYVKDEDYRLSFLHGNYITLTNLKRSDFQRIIDERLSPLYVSVHATDPSVRLRLLGLRTQDNILKSMKRLTDSGIRLHTQIVVCPGWNDGEVLQQTVQDLSTLVPGLQSISLVPVGLTRHRHGLTPLRGVTISEAKGLVKFAGDWQRKFLDKFDMRVIYPSDELFLMAGKRIPRADYYEDFPQVENGVGLVRMFIDDLKSQWRALPDQVPNTWMALVTGQLAAPILREKVVPNLLKVRGLRVDVVAVSNRLFGGVVTVSGLLGGRDIISALSNCNHYDLVVLPPNVLNNNLFIDDLSLEKFRKLLKTPVFVSDKKEEFALILRKISEKLAKKERKASERKRKKR